MDHKDKESEDEDVTPPKKKKYTKRVQKYRSMWEKTLKWLTPEEDNTKAFCKVCNVSLKAELHVLKLHDACQRHKQNLSAKKAQPFIEKFTLPIPTIIRNDVKVAEIKLAGFFAEHNVPFTLVDHLVPLLKEIAPDSRTLSDMQLGRTKLTALVKNVIGLEHKNDLIQTLKMSKFSILTDESTDISCQKTACIVVRYYDQGCSRIRSSFWELIQLFGDSADQGTVDTSVTGERLYNVIVNSFEKHNIPLSNVVGFASDGCNVMMGKNNSVASRFIDNFPGIVIVKCICHSAHLCDSEACKQLPRHCEDLSRNIYNHFKYSSKRQHDFRQFQSFLNLEIHKLLHPSQTRWLSLNEVVGRIIEQWDALKLYFTNTWLSDRLVATEQIFNALNDPFMKLYYLFLLWILPKFTEFNKYFQSARVVITELHTKIVSLYCDILMCYMDRVYVQTTPVESINPNDSSKFISVNNMYLGVNVLNHLNDTDVKSSPQLEQDFRLRCRQFLITACEQIKKRFDFRDGILKFLTALSPENALSNSFRSHYPSLQPLYAVSKRFLPNNVNMIQAIDDEWRKLPMLTDDGIRKEQIIDTFWGKLASYKNVLGEYEYRNLALFAISLLCIPHANADCERIFSKVNLIKTKPRNKLATRTVNGALLASQCIANSESCLKFQPTTAMVKSCNSQMYDHKNFKEEENLEEEGDGDFIFSN
ncbi:hypothetical protein PPYR_14935 [Photinus pyralis]|nr:uncharacterized protein LOC116178401 [Photinus pyralis]XP_031357982.1 uncharacterized protein LOC116181711 [Photinus pyralis]XP_031358610.1 uncharacterized protein LOC116182231 [Photinus pyralis]KAB0790621.1 hypothetical protein PPYR_14935 [Photinus pyralis]